jgi:hypothetical protein
MTIPRDINRAHVGDRRRVLALALAAATMVVGSLLVLASVGRESMVAGAVLGWAVAAANGASMFWIDRRAVMRARHQSVVIGLALNGARALMLLIIFFVVALAAPTLFAPFAVALGCGYVAFLAANIYILCDSSNEWCRAQ